MRTLGRRMFVLCLFAALVAVLLWFQGILLRNEPVAAEVPGAPLTSASDRTARVERIRVPRTLVYPGFVEAVDPAAIAPRAMANLVEVRVREGDLVAEGAILATLDDRDARARLAQAEAAREAAAAGGLQAQLAFERAQRLRDAEALTVQDWEAARAARDAAQANERRAAEAVAEAQAALGWYQLTAPFEGCVLARHAEPGDLAVPGRPVITLYRADRLRLSVAIPEERAATLVAGAELEVVFDELGVRSARLERVLPAADPRTGTVTLHLALEGAGSLREGLLGRLQLAIGEREALTIPAAAVERIGQVERVQLVRDGRHAPVTVRTGKAHGDRIEILSGLAEGEVVRLP